MELYSSGVRNRHRLEEKLSLWLLYWSVIMPILTGIPTIPSALKYTADVIWFGLVLCCVLKRKIRIRRDILPLAFAAAFLLVYVTLTYLLRYQTLRYFIWGVRNLFRYYVAFFAYAVALKTDRVEKWFDFIEKVFWVNVAISIYQFAVMGVVQDFLGGVFGVKGGTNGYTTTLLTIVVTRSLLMSFAKKGNLWRCLLTCAAAMSVAAMAEIKFFFVLFIVILICCVIMTKFSLRKLIVTLAGSIAVIIGTRMLVKWFGFSEVFSIQGIIEEATKSSYASSSADDVNRLSAIYTLNQRILTEPFDRIIGLGLGNCDTSAFAVFNTPFFEAHGAMHYTWFVAPMIYLETGYIGIAIYISFFVACFVQAMRKNMRKDGNLLYCRMAMIMSITCCILMFYNASLRYEAAYMIYFILALPFLRQSSGDKTVFR